MGNGGSVFDPSIRTFQDNIHWEHQNSESEWERFDIETSKIIESNFLEGKKKIIFHNRDCIIDFTVMEVRLREREKGRSIRRRIVWNIENTENTLSQSTENQLISPRSIAHVGNTTGISQENSFETSTTVPIENRNDIVDFIRGLREERDKFASENSRLKTQISEISKNLQDAIESRDIALTLQSDALRVLQVKNEELGRMLDSENELNEKLAAKTKEVANLTQLNSELRIKLTSELTELGKTISPKVEETEKLMNKVKTLQISLEDKERELEYIKNETPRNTPRDSPHTSVITANKSPRRESNVMSPRLKPTNLPPVTSPRSPDMLSPTSIRPALPQLSLPNEEMKRTNGVKSPTNTPLRTSKFKSATSPTDSPHNKSGRTSARTGGGWVDNYLGKKGRVSNADMDNDIKKFIYEIDDLKEKLNKLENKCQTLEGDLQVEKLRCTNLNRDLIGKEQEIEMLRQQKVSLKDELNEQIALNQSNGNKLNESTNQISRLEEKVKKSKLKLQNSTLQKSGMSDSDDERKEFEEKLSHKKEKYNNIKTENIKLQGSISELNETINKLENSLNEKINELNNKENEIKKLKEGQKDVVNAKLFKALAEEAQKEKSKCLTLTNKIKTLTEEIKEKDLQIELLKLPPDNNNNNNDITEKLNSLQEELDFEKSKSSNLLSEIEKFKENEQKNSFNEEDVKSQLESLRQEIINKDKEIEQLKKPKPLSSDKMFRALAEEAQMAKTQCLTLSKQVEDLKKNLANKDKEIEQLILAQENIDDYDDDDDVDDDGEEFNEG